MVSLLSTNHAIGLSSLFDLDTSGGRTCSGRLSSALATRSRTSLDAASISRLILNSIVMFERPLRLDEFILLIPSIPDIRFSITWVILVSIISADAPVYVVLIFTIGVSISGYSRSGNMLNATKPKVSSNKLITIAKTGRLTLVSVIFTYYPLTLTLLPERILISPSVIICWPSVKPSSIATQPLFLLATCTSILFATPSVILNT